MTEKNKIVIRSSFNNPHKVVRTTTGLQVKQPKTSTIVKYTN